MGKTLYGNLRAGLMSSLLSPRHLAAGLAMGIALAPAPVVYAQPASPTPESFFGVEMGADRVLHPWSRMVAYYRELERTSDRIKVVELGQSTEGRPFLALFISSPENLARLDEYRQMNARLADPRGVPQAELDRIVAEGKAVIVESFDLHSTEIGSSLTAVEFTYDLVTRTDPEALNILDNTIAIIMPSLNPDGHDIVQKYYMEQVGTPYEGGPIPSLYQKYAGHDNNRDAFMQNLSESRHLGRLLFRDWIPQAYVDHHQMGQYAPRLSLPPYADPIRPDADPLVWREMDWYGSHMAYKLDEAQLPGSIGYAIYSGWGHMGFHWITPFHNIAGMLTESASANLATPLYVHPDQLQGGQRNVIGNDPQMNMPDPWPGGWWRPRDIVNQQKVAAWALLDMAARNRETVLRNGYLKAQRQIERGAEADVTAYVIEADQHDPLTVVKMINTLMLQGVEIYRTPTELVHEGRVYSAGSFVVSMAQPKMGVVRYMLGETHYPDNEFTRDGQGIPIRPYDMSTDALTEFMGVESTPASTAVELSGLQRLSGPLTVAGVVEPGATTYTFSGALNDSYRAANLLLARGARIQRVQSATGELALGDFIVTGATSATLQQVATTTGVSFSGADGTPSSALYAVTAPRIGVFNRYRGGNMDEGWTRLMLEQFDFRFTTIMDRDLGSNLRSRYDVIVLPSDSVWMMTGERPPAGGAGEGGGGGGGNLDAIPPALRRGFGDAGVRALRSFVEAGGRLLTFGQAGELPIQKFELPVRNILTGQSTTQFYSPGSTLNIDIDNSNPLAFGMPEEGLATFIMGSQVYEVLPRIRNERVSIIAEYDSDDVLQSGWLIGEDVIADKAAMVSVELGRGEVVLIGFRPQHRDQTHGTFKLVFDSLFNGPPS